MCMGTFVMSNLRRLKIAARDSYCGAVKYCRDDPYIASKKIQVGFEPGILETVQLVMQVYFELKRNNGIKNHVTLIFEKDNPAAVRIANEFYANNLPDMHAAGKLPFGELFDEIAGRWELVS